MSNEMTNQKDSGMGTPRGGRSELMIKNVEQKELHPLSGGVMVVAEAVLLLLCVLAYVWAGMRLNAKDIVPALPAAAIVAASLGVVVFCWQASVW